MSRTPAMPGHRRTCAVVASALLTLATGAAAQDSHYWSEQYGTQAALLGGAVIGSVRDLSAVYYNPGAVALNPDAGFILSARAYRQGTITIEDGAGLGLDLSSSSSRPIATMLATPLDFDFLGSHSLTYSVLTRQQFDTHLATYAIREEDLTSAPGDEDFAGAFDGDATLRETWTGLTWAYPLSERLGIGVSPFLAIRSREVRSAFLAQASSEAPDVGTVVRLRNRRYKHYRGLVRIGLSYQTERYSLGWTATTPSISLMGSGFASYNSSGTTSVDIPELIDEPFLAANVQSDLSAEYRSGWITGGGAGMQLWGATLHGSVEWFQGTEPTMVLDAAGFVPQTGGDVIENDMVVELRSVLNWGLGIERGIGGARLFAGYATDNSAGVPGTEFAVDPVLTRYNLEHVTAGASFRLSRLDLMLGAGYASGTSTFPSIFDPGDISPDPDLDPDSSIRLDQWTFFLGAELLPGNGGDDDPEGAGR